MKPRGEPPARPRSDRRGIAPMYPRYPTTRPRKNRTDRRAPRGIAPAHERKIAEKWASRWKIISRAGPRMEASQAAHGGRPSRGAISCTRCAFVMAVRPRSAAGGSRAQRPRWRPRARCREPRAQRRSCPCPRGRRVCRPTMARRWQGLENLGDRPQAESPAARSQSLPEEQKARSCAASASCRWGGGGLLLCGAAAPPRH